MHELTQKQNDFCLAYVETGNASEAYRQVYNAITMKPETVHRKAKELMDNGKITARIEELKAKHAERHAITVDSLLNELEEARTMAKEKENPNAMTQATMGKAKLLGLDKQVIEAKVEEIEPFHKWLDRVTNEQGAYDYSTLGKPN